MALRKGCRQWSSLTICVNSRGRECGDRHMFESQVIINSTSGDQSCVSRIAMLSLYRVVTQRPVRCNRKLKNQSSMAANSSSFEGGSAATCPPVDPVSAVIDATWVVCGFAIRSCLAMRAISTWQNEKV